MLKAILGILTIFIFGGFTLHNVEYNTINLIIYYVICGLIIALMIL